MLPDSNQQPAGHDRGQAPGWDGKQWWMAVTNLPQCLGWGTATSHQLPGGRGDEDRGVVRMQGVRQARSHSPCYTLSQGVKAHAPREAQALACPAAAGPSRAGWASIGSHRNWSVRPAGREHTAHLASVVPLGGPEAYTVPQPAASGHTHCISGWELGCCDSDRGGACGSPGAVQAPKVSWDLLFHTRCSRFNHWPGLGTVPACAQISCTGLLVTT